MAEVQSGDCAFPGRNPSLTPQQGITWQKPKKEAGEKFLADSMKMCVCGGGGGWVNGKITWKEQKGHLERTFCSEGCPPAPLPTTINQSP